MIYGMARVSTEGQNLERQIDAMKQYGVDKLYTEKESGKNLDRPELKKVLQLIREGDKLVVYELARLGRSTKELLELSEKLKEKGAELVSIKENIDTSTATGKMAFTILAAFAEFERNTIVERTKEGLAAARSRGRIGGRPPVPDEKIRKAIKMKQGGFTLPEIEEMTGVKKDTLYRRLRRDR